MAPKTRSFIGPQVPSVYVWQHPAWPAFAFDDAVVAPAIANARRMQAQALERLHAIGLVPSDPTARAALEQEAIATAAIEGEKLDPAAVRLSVMRGLGMADADAHDRRIDGLVDVLRDAVADPHAPLDDDRLWRWQSSLFPGGTGGVGGVQRIAVGRYRNHADEMQIVSGVLGKEVVHYQAPPSAQVPGEMRQFLKWFNQTPQPNSERKSGHAPGMAGIARAAIAHLWFESIHPFEDGNGRVGRALIERAMAQDASASGRDPSVRIVSLSRELLQERRAYYDQLAAAQRPRLAAGSDAGARNATCDATAWVQWFATAYANACQHALGAVEQAVAKAQFLALHALTDLNPRQRKMMQRLLDAGDGGFLGGMSADKYSQLTQTSKATATRDLADLLAAHVLWSHGQGKATRYYLNVAGWGHGLR